MLVVCNGGMKGGSTWVTQIVRSLRKWNEIPSEYKNQNWQNPSLLDDKLSKFLASGLHVSNHYYCKQHWANRSEYKDLLSDPDVKVLNIVRDVRDVLVSRYFHDFRLGETECKDVEEYYWKGEGQKRLEMYMTYQVFWHPKEKGLQPFLLYYEDMLSHHKDRIQDIANFLHITISTEKLEEICNDTKFSAKKNTGPGNFFRKGVAGDYKNHLTNIMIEDIFQRAEQFGFFDSFPTYRNT